MTISPGSLLPTDVTATLPLHIVNFLSIDPPVSSPHITSTQLDSNLKTLSILSRSIDAVSERSEENLVEDPTEDRESFYSDEDTQQDSEDIANNGGHGLGNLLLRDDTDEVVQYAIASARTDLDYAEHAPRFADLYYSSLQENLDHAAEQYVQKKAMDNSLSQVSKSDETRGCGNSFASRVHEKTLRRQFERPDRPQEGYAGKTEAEGVLYEMNTIHEGHQVSHFRHPNPYTQSEPRTAVFPDPNYGHHVASATASSNLATPISPNSRLGPRSFQSAENPYIYKQNPPANNIYKTSIAYDPDSASISTALRSKSVKDKIRELEERAERVNIDA